MTRSQRQQTAALPRLLEDAFPVSNETAAQQIVTDARSYLEPLLNSAGGCSTPCTQRTAKTYSSFVIQLLRAAMAQVTEHQPSCITNTIVQLASLSLEALSILRESLKGKPYEVEMQRYMLVRKLVSLKSYRNAMHQAWVLYMALCCQCWQPMSALPPSDCNAVPARPLPVADTCRSKEVASLVVGTILNLLLSVVEQDNFPSTENQIMTIVQDHEAIMSWVR